MRQLLRRLGDYARASPGEVGLVAVLGLAVAATSVVTVVRSREPAPPTITKHLSASPSAVELVTVHVAGLVRLPGVYQVPKGSRVQTVIEAAGGPIEGADVHSLNLAAELADGQKIYVPRVGESVPATSGADAGSGFALGQKVNLNTATEQQLDTLPGVGPTTAERIIAFRTQKGRFTSVRQLLEVEGIGPKKYEALKDLVTV